MTARMIWTIFRKDLIDAVRDARVLIALIVPLGIGVFYNLAFEDELATPSAEVIYTASEATALPDHLRAVAGDAIEVRFTRVESDARLRDLIAEESADIGLILSPGFDTAVAAGLEPPLTVVTPEEASFSANYVVAALDPALRRMAGQDAPARIAVTAQAQDPAEQAIFDRLGLRTWAVTVSAVMMIAMIAMLAVPVILAEETEKKTLDALVMIASYADVVVAKALVGFVYVGVMIGILLVLTGLSPGDAPLFAMTVAALAVTLIGFGLLLGGLFRNANQLNTWSGVLLLPVVTPAFMAALPLPSVLETIISLIPTGEGTKMLINGVTGETLFDGVARAFLVLAVWSAGAYALLLWQLSRRQA